MLELDESGGNQQISNGQILQGLPSVGQNITMSAEEQLHGLQYSIPGILHFIQHEWARFEMERSQWDVERAELQARIAFLQGERQGQENLKRDLVRRIKMLEYALKQERSKNKTKFSGELVTDNKLLDQTDDLNGDVIMPGSIGSNSWKQGRQLLRKYLQEIGYTDTIIDVRSARVRQLLGLTPNNNEVNKDLILPAINGEQGRRREAMVGQRESSSHVSNTLGETMVLESEAAIMDTFPFLSPENEVEVEDDDEEMNDADLMDDIRVSDEVERLDQRRHKAKAMNSSNEGMARMDDLMAAETEEALSEFDFLGPDGDRTQEFDDEADIAVDDQESFDDDDWSLDESVVVRLKEQYRFEQGQGRLYRNAQRPKRSALQAMLASLGGSEDEIGPPSLAPNASPGTYLPSNANYEDEGAMEANIPFPGGPRYPLRISPENDVFESQLGLGELAGLTVCNEAELTYDQLSTDSDAMRKTWNAKYTLRSHFDGIRALAFHPDEPVLITASEDHTLKLWNLEKTVPAKKAASLDVEPIYTFRGHSGPVLSLAMSSNGEECFSGGADSVIQCWRVPSFNIDPYDSYDPSVLTQTLNGHLDAVWGLSMHRDRLQLLSCSADSTIRLWAPHTSDPMLRTILHDSGSMPMSIDFVHSDPELMVASFSNCDTIIYDLETAKPVLHLDTNKSTDTDSPSVIYHVVSHPTLPVTVTSHEDRHIRFYDNNTGKMIHSMVAHLEAVTSLAIDPNGLYLLSGSHDCSIRLWNLDSKTCIQEITSHRKKFDEAIYDVAFHPSKPYIASAGADALAKVFV